jgi:hypothetical protein
MNTILEEQLSTGQNKRIAPFSFHECHKATLSSDNLLATKRLTALTPEIDCDQTAMGSPPVMSAVIAK